MEGTGGVAEEAHADLGGVCPVARGLVPHGTVVGIVTVGCLVGYFGGGAENTTEATVLVAGCAVDGSAVYSVPTGVVAVAVFNRVNGVATALVDVAVVTIDTAIMSVFDACLDDTVVGETCAVGTVATEAEGCVCECEYGFGECAVVDPTAIVTAVLCAAGIGGVVGAVV